MSVGHKCSWKNGGAGAGAASPFVLYEGHPKWPTFDLTYAFTTDFPDVAKPALLSAFRRWEAVSQFRFTEKIGPPITADVKIGFYSGKHCDDKPFHGPGGAVAAHAFRPTDGRMHLNEEKKWSFGEADGGGLDFETVAVHELGHILGLDHSTNSSAVMYHEIYPGEIKRELHQDDIQGINYLYTH